MSVRTNLDDNDLQMNPIQKGVQHWFLQGLCVALFPVLLAGCDGSYSSATPVDSKTKVASVATAAGVVWKEGTVAPVHTADAKLMYVFSDDTVTYYPPCPSGVSCPKGQINYVGNPVKSYTIEKISGKPSYIDMPGDLTPSNTKSIATSPSGNFLYMLTGENLVYTFSIGYLNFTAAEFKNSDPLKLYNALSRDGIVMGTVLSSEQVVDKLISLLEEPTLFDRLAAKNPGLVMTDEISELQKNTVKLRGALFSDLSYLDKKLIVNLNRLMTELVYPNTTPKNKGVSSLHVVDSPLSLPTAFGSATNVVVEPFGQFAYVLGSSSLGIYAIDQSNGALIARGTQPIALGQVIFAPSGIFAYGSTNGYLYTFSLDRNSGKFTELGNPIPFTPWTEAEGYNYSLYPPSPPPPWWQKDQYHNMAADPTGKFLYLIASAGYRRDPMDNGDCFQAEHQIGSSVYTFIIDNNTGLLTQSGPPLDTRPHIMVWGDVDPQGRFVQLLNTHEFSGEKVEPDIGTCTGGGTAYALQPGNIYSYYVNQSSGQLIPSGTMAAGGREYPTGFVNASINSGSIKGNSSGKYLYLLNQFDMYMFNVDQADGALNAVGSALTGPTVTVMPLSTNPAVNWPPVCFDKNSVPKICTTTLRHDCCEVSDSRAHSMIWAGY